MEFQSYFIGICLFIGLVFAGINYKNSSSACKKWSDKCSTLDECCTLHSDCCSNFCYKSFAWLNGICMDSAVVQKLQTNSQIKVDPCSNCNKKNGSPCSSDSNCKSAKCFKENSWNKLGVCKSFDFDENDSGDDNDDNDVYDEFGLCSYYNPEGETTASGEPYDKYGYTAAHRTLPFDTIVRVNIGEQNFDVRINDRGPDDDNKILNLAFELARRMHIVEQDMVPCKIKSMGISHAEVQQRNDKIDNNKNKNENKTKSNKHRNKNGICKQLYNNTCLTDRECCTNYCEKIDPTQTTGVCKLQPIKDNIN